MPQQRLHCGLLGGREADLGLLSELHRQEGIHLEFVYDPEETAVGLEIAEIMGVPAYHALRDIEGVARLDYAIVSEPRDRFGDAPKILESMGATLLTPGEAMARLGSIAAQKVTEPVADNDLPATVDDTLVALERLLDRQKLMRFLLDVAVRSTTSDAGSIMLHSEEAQELYIGYATGLSERVTRSTRQRLGEGIAGNVALRREPKLLHMPAEQALYGTERERVDIASAISVPLVWDERLLGVLNVSSGREGHRHAADDLRRLTGLATRIARVLFESLRLQEVELRRSEARFRSTSGEIAQKPIPTKEKLTVLCGYLADIMGAETVEVFITTAEGDWFVLGGSNRLLTPERERIRLSHGALSRCFLEQRVIVMTETGKPGEDPFAVQSSIVYCHLPTRDIGGVLTLEFSDRYKLDEFLVAREAIIEEVTRFISNELRERLLRRKLAAFSRVSDAAATVLGCRTVADLCDVMTRVVRDVLECHRVSVRLREGEEDNAMHVSQLTAPGRSSAAWEQEDEERFAKLESKKEAFTVAFLDFETPQQKPSPEFHSLLAFPIESEDRFHGGIIAYDKEPADPLEDAVFGELDRTILENLARLVLPILSAISGADPIDVSAAPDTYATVLANNLERLEGVCTAEIARSERYHHSFSLVLFRITPLEGLFEEDSARAFALVDDITQGIRTRTRKTDYGAWIDRTTYALLSLEGSSRIRFLVSRAVIYLQKDLSAIGGPTLGAPNILVGTAIFPGASGSTAELIAEAESALKPTAGE